jgi:hypothetical protein
MKIIIKYLLLFYLIFAVSAVFAQDKEIITKEPKFKPPVVKTYLGVNQNGASVTKEEASQLIGLPLKIVDDKKNAYPVDSYQFLYRRKSTVLNNDGKRETVFTIVADRFFATPLPKVWIENTKDQFQKDEQLYFFDIVVKDKEGRKFFAPELKITIK